MTFAICCSSPNCVFFWNVTAPSMSGHNVDNYGRSVKDIFAGKATKNAPMRESPLRGPAKFAGRAIAKRRGFGYIPNRRA